MAKNLPPPPHVDLDPLRSPVVDALGRVTVRFRAPGARSVLLAVEGAPPLPLRPGKDGLWSATTQALAPDFYPYTIVVDGVSQADPGNPLSKPIVSGGGQSLAHVPGKRSLSWEWNRVPHGSLHHHFLESRAIGGPTEFHVYTPPGYDPRGSERYPVLFLLHGITDDARAWTTAGRAHVILDNLIARGKLKPLIMVNPLGYGLPHPEDNLKRMLEPGYRMRSLRNFAKAVTEEMLPMVDSAYRLQRSRQARAIAGLSMGGAQACYIGLRHPDLFAWIGSFSGGFILFGDRGSRARVFPDAGPGWNRAFRLLWIACGVDDFLLESNRGFTAWLASRGVRHTYIESPGAHTWLVWKRYLAGFLPLLF